MPIRLGLLLLGLVHAANGLFMLADPRGWYAAVPGVTQTGPINIHFIDDVGLAFLVSGIAMALGALRGARTVGLALAGAVFPLAHAALHVVDWITDGVPRDPAAALTEAIGVIAIGILGAWLAWLRFTRETDRAQEALSSPGRRLREDVSL